MDAEKVRLYGKAPYRVAVVHGGPGAAGEMAPVARRLGATCGVLEPLQTAMTVAGQTDELAGVLGAYANGPVTLVGHSWGAWLSLLTAGKFPELVGKVVLVSSGPFREADAASIMRTRLARLDVREQRRTHEVMQELYAAGPAPKDAALAAFGALMAKADAVDPLPPEAGDAVSCRQDIFQSVWDEAHALRKSGELLVLAQQVRCPVVVMHGADDPHPFLGVRDPLAAILPDCRFLLLPHCGHTPWLERRAKDRFFQLLGEELLLVP